MMTNASADDWRDYADYPAIRYERHFGDRVLPCFVNRPQTIYSLFANGLELNADGDALVYENGRLTYSELSNCIDSTAAGLSAHGVEQGTRVAVLLRNCSEYVILFFAVAKLGAILVPLNVKETAHELGFILNDCEAELVIHGADLADRVPDKSAVVSLCRIISVDIDSEQPLEIFSGHGRTEDAVPISEDETGVILYTSGTTGRPKGAKICQLNFVHSVLHYHFAMRMGPEDRSIIAVPMSHVTGLVALVAVAAHSGAALIIMREFSAESFLNLVAAERITHTLLVPTMFALCLLRPDVSKKDLSSWRVSGYGGAIMPEATLAKISNVIPDLDLINCYGATETTSPAVMMPPELVAERTSEVGLPVVCADVRVMDPHGVELPVGEAGEIWITGPMVVPGYWNNPEATAKEFVGSYWKSGDLGIKDERGFIRIIDRIKDVINRGGYKIHASEVENHLLLHASVNEVAVVAKPCPVLGERVHAFVVANEDCEQGDLVRHCREDVAEFKQPEKYHFVSELPRNANGKVLKRELKKILEDR